ncbi:hypothetical protein QBC33DRAFT_525093 [Phialemonium atrogriseum]|uniref:Uncharacterized protein n=1 Tax=Phialemonium atrogriseum TaxID=1093897 RepID=A0AAJ0FKR3_9PEZI|nr:uncharacterized protein QBC33DRAFT_525093 [Phialemonium atrogriseum]KAK1771881.1 hypothetical protein QBC33DRAFT_525093 [Phialemonium atrogriseum]
MGNFRFNTEQRCPSEFAIPNLRFHLTTCYCIVQHLWVEIGAMKFLRMCLRSCRGTVITVYSAVDNGNYRAKRICGANSMCRNILIDYKTQPRH